jgi:hypothetical protein
MRQRLTLFSSFKGNVVDNVPLLLSDFILTAIPTKLWVGYGYSKKQSSIQNIYSNLKKYTNEKSIIDSNFVD